MCSRSRRVTSGHGEKYPEGGQGKSIVSGLVTACLAIPAPGAVTYKTDRAVIPKPPHVRPPLLGFSGLPLNGDVLFMGQRETLFSTFPLQIFGHSDTSPRAQS
jgi:hypothetical protein